LVTAVLTVLSVAMSRSHIYTAAHNLQPRHIYSKHFYDDYCTELDVDQAKYQIPTKVFNTFKCIAF